MTSWANRRREEGLHLDYLRQEAQQVFCPECQAAAGDACRNVNDGGPLGKAPHLKRIKAAELAGQVAAEENET